MPVLNGIEIKDLAQMIGLYEKDPTLRNQTLGAAARWDGILRSQVILNKTIQGSGGDCLYAEELLCVLAKCVVNDLLVQAQHRGVDVASTHVAVEGDIDFGGSVGLEAPAGFQALRISVDVATTASSADIHALVDAVERTSIVGQSLVAVPQDWSVERTQVVKA